MEIKKLTEVIVVGGVLAVAMAASLDANAAAVSIAASSTGQSGISVTSGSAGGYTLAPFVLTLSASVSMQYDGDTTGAWVNTANARGMHTFGGSTTGIAPRACETSSVSTPSANAPSASSGC